MKSFILLLAVLIQPFAWSSEPTQDLPVKRSAKSVAYFPQLNAGSINVSDYKLQHNTALYLSVEELEFNWSMRDKCTDIEKRGNEKLRDLGVVDGTITTVYNSRRECQIYQCVRYTSCDVMLNTANPDVGFILKFRNKKSHEENEYQNDPGFIVAGTDYRDINTLLIRAKK